MERIQPLLGLATIIGLLVLFSANRKAIRWRLIAWGLGLQLVLGVLILHTDGGRWVFQQINVGFQQVIAAAEEGGLFVFGEQAKVGHLPVGDFDEEGEFRADARTYARVGFGFAYRVLPIIIFFSALMSAAYYLGIMQFVVRIVARVMRFTLKTSGSETTSAAANIFVGQTEAPLMVRPFIARMTRSELMAIMTGGFATTSGGILAAYITLLRDTMPDIGAHLVTCSVLSAPASIMLAKIAIPETEESETAGTVQVETQQTSVNVIDAFATGTIQGMKLALNVAVMLISFIALIALVNLLVGAASTSRLVGLEEPLTLDHLVGWALWPAAWLLGVAPEDCGTVGSLLGIKTFLNELIAYERLAEIDTLSPRSFRIASYALCGFANIGSVGIQIGGLSAMAPNRQGDIARLGFRAMAVGAMATASSACVVAILT